MDELSERALVISRRMVGSKWRLVASLLMVAAALVLGLQLERFDSLRLYFGLACACIVLLVFMVHTLVENAEKRE